MNALKKTESEVRKGMNTETFNILMKAIITIIGIVVTTYIVPWIKSRIDADKLDKIVEYTEIAVRCAEQIYTKEQWKEKKQYVYDYIIKKAADIDIKLDEHDIDVIIEGLVHELKKDY